MRVLVTGATGYIGGRLIPRLLERGHDIRVLVRDRDRVAPRLWADAVDVVEGDLLRPETLGPALEGMAARAISSLGTDRRRRISQPPPATCARSCTSGGSSRRAGRTRSI
jgi:uncharacterized protein YbjT (DUF2867 family)